MSLWYEMLGGSGMDETMTMSVQSCATLIWTSRSSWPSTVGAGGGVAEAVMGGNTDWSEGGAGVGDVVFESNNDSGNKDEGVRERSSTAEIALSVTSVL